LLARRARDLQLEHPLEGGAVGQPGQRVGAGQSLDPLRALDQRVRQAR
jgi:hypothetical protein